MTTPFKKPAIQERPKVTLVPPATTQDQEQPQTEMETMFDDPWKAWSKVQINPSC
jgi:hypothetical protein